MSVFTVTLLANLLFIPSTVIAVTAPSANVAAWQFILFWIIAWIVESLFLGLSLRQELGLSKAFALPC